MKFQIVTIIWNVPSGCGVRLQCGRDPLPLAIAMGTERAAEGFLRHRGLILAAAGGAVAEGGLLVLFAPKASSLAPQVTALPSLAAYHDLRWLFTDTQSRAWFAGLVLAVLAARAVLDVALLRLAWPRGLPPPGTGRALLSCAGLTLLAWVLLSPAVTLAFGVAVLPFSWPFLAAFPLMLGIVAALSHGGVFTAWWRRLPPARAAAWLLVSLAAATVAAAVITRLPAGGALAVTAAVGVLNARAWYAVAGLAARLPPRAHASAPARMLFSVPYAPLAAVMVLVLVVGVARLLFTGTIQLPISPSPGAAAAVPAGLEAGPRAPSGGPSPRAASAVLVVGGWGSSCCNAADGLRAALHGVPVRQFSYTGLGARGRPVPSGPSADDLPLPVLGARIAAQVRALHAASGRPVAVVAESEGTLGVYAMLASYHGLPLSSVALLSPIVGPGQLSYPPGSDGAPVSADALDELNHLVGGMSPYGPSGARRLINSVGELGARYVSALTARTVVGAGGQPVRWLAVVPLADAVTLPECGLPPHAVVVPAFHGGLLGDPAVLTMLTAFLSGRDVTPQGDVRLREAAELITGAATAWRMPDTTAACPFPAG